MERLEHAGQTLVRRLLVDSAVCRAVAAGYRKAIDGARRVDAALGRVPLPPPDPNDEARAKSVLASSRLVRWIDAALDVPGRAWQSSTLRRWMQPSVDGVRALPLPERIRLLGLVLLIAAITHIVLVLAVADPVGWPTWVAWVSFVAAAVVLVRWPAEVLAAWPTSRLRRWIERRR